MTDAKPTTIEVDPLVARYLKWDLANMAEELQDAASKGQLADVVLMARSICRLAVALIERDTPDGPPARKARPKAPARKARR